ncbi:hypothetical protein LZ31DRAFT_279682 [Colletotrichum somersetense]|nr:hypothetical protein LZ31DRAFT_279682 [Colletotrichum somersetense]
MLDKVASHVSVLLAKAAIVILTLSMDTCNATCRQSRITKLGLVIVKPKLYNEIQVVNTLERSSPLENTIPFFISFKSIYMGLFSPTLIHQRRRIADCSLPSSLVAVSNPTSNTVFQTLRIPKVQVSPHPVNFSSANNKLI